MKVKLPSFNGNISIEEYLDWVSEVEKFFNYMGSTNDKHVYLVAYKLKGRASAWWDCVQLNCNRKRKIPMRSWRRMKRLMNGRSVLTTRLPARVVQTIPGLQVGYLDS